MTHYPKLFAPLIIGPLKIKNRIALAPMGTGLANMDDTLSDRLISFYTRIAQGGAGLVITGVAAVSRDGAVGPGMNSLYDDRYMPRFRMLAASVHAAGAKLAVHLMHAGMEAFPFYMKRKRLVSPSGGVFGPNQMRFQGMDLNKTSMPSAVMSKEDISLTGDAFATAARRAQLAGADAVELNGAQGFLLQQFYSPTFNKRTDEYGGTFANRMRFPLEVVDKVRRAVGPEFPLIFRMVVTEGPGGGIDVSDAIDIAQTLERSGVDALHLTAGRGISPAVWTLMMPIAEDGPAPISNQIGMVKDNVGIPVIGVQRILDPSTASSIIESGQADMVALGRALIADPDWPRKTASGCEEDIRKCIGCLQGCIGTQISAGFANCLQNPEAGKENQMRLQKAEKKKNVLVVGSGPAGLESALIAGRRGHDVLLCEKDSQLGGQWSLASVPPGKQDFSWVIEWRINQLEKLPNVTVQTDCEVTPELVNALSPEVAVLATGSVPAIPDIPGVDYPQVLTAHAVLAGTRETGARVAVIGGGATGCETANYLGAQGKKVTLVESLPDVGSGEEPARKVWLLRSLAGYGVEILTHCSVREIRPSGELLVSRTGIEGVLGTFDNIVLATGVRGYDPLSPFLEKIASEVYVVGDAYAMPTNGLDALHHAAAIARTF